MKNKQKAEEICCTQGCSGGIERCIKVYGQPCQIYTNCLEMAEWKDQQHSVAYVVTRSDLHYDEVEKVFFDIEKAEQYCAGYNNDENEYVRNITKINITL